MRGGLSDRGGVLRITPPDAFLRKLRTLLASYWEAGGTGAHLLLHAAEHGDPLIRALAHFGEGLPAHVLPLAVNAVTQVGLRGSPARSPMAPCPVRFLLPARPAHAMAGLRQTIELAQVILTGLGYGADAVAMIETDDPQALAARSAPRRFAPRRRGSPTSCRSAAKRSLLRQTLRELQRLAPTPVAVLPLPGGRAARHGSARCRGLHAMPCLRLGLPDRGAQRRSRAAGVALCRGCLRAVRPVPGHLSRKKSSRSSRRSI